MEKLSCKLENLPREVQDQIVAELDYSSFIALSQTSLFFHTAFPPESSPQGTKTAFVLRAENFSRHCLNGYGCFRCFRVLPRERFGDKQLKTPRGKGGVQSYKRFCVDCGLNSNGYSVGSIVKQKGLEKVVCFRCKIPREGMHCRCCHLCQECLRIPRGSNYPDGCPRCRAKESFLGTPLAGDWGDWDYDPVTALGLALRMAEFEETFGFAASPEWFEGDDFP